MTTLPVLPVVPDGQCGACRHWTREDAYLGSCAFGWVAHDPPAPPPGRGRLPVGYPHGGIEKPLTSFHAACFVELDEGTAFAARPQEVTS
ncbi:hypothetical protein [Deinococcus pimensis]|uniref:hypothetical protein n=1 Tax=Deinococcus pimensis TaxID=309888 RepID=UPI0004813A02|nr:hypothetical protein [Deinococcus pimensis]